MATARKGSPGYANARLGQVMCTRVACDKVEFDRGSVDLTKIGAEAAVQCRADGTVCTAPATRGSRARGEGCGTGAFSLVYTNPGTGLWNSECFAPGAGDLDCKLLPAV